MVVASDDPTEKASGRGLGILRDEGVEITLAEGELAARARLLNQGFRKHARTGRPWVLFKSAMTLDGKVATRTGDSKWISGEDSRRLSHRWRAECDAVAVGIGTALADDPQLTSRIEGVHRQPRRIVFDSEARLPLDSALIRGAPELPLTVVVSRAAPRTATDGLEAAGADVVVATGENEPARVKNALVQLGAAGITSILLEGGPHIAGAFLDAGEVDEIRLFLAPVWSAARPPATRSRAPAWSGSPRPRARSRSSARGSPTTCSSSPACGSGDLFTGLVADLGTIIAVDATDGGVRLGVRTALAPSIGEGDSVAVNGVCLTATEIVDGAFTADVMNETLRRSSLAEVGEGAPVNLELPLRAEDRLGGHFVQGHVDGLGTVRDLRPDGFAQIVEIAAPPEILRYIVEKGSIAVDGISLTVASVTDRPSLCR